MSIYKEKLAIVTISIGEAFEKIARTTHPTIKDYAERCGADFIVWDEQNTDYINAAFMKFELGTLLTKYDRLIYIDTDCIVKKNTPNLFDIIPEGAFAAFNEGILTCRKNHKANFCIRVNIYDQAWVESNYYFNSGVMVIPKICKDVFTKPEVCINNFYEQTQLNYLIHKSRIPTIALDYKFNAMNIKGLDQTKGNIIHFAGVDKNILALKIEELLNSVKKLDS